MKLPLINRMRIRDAWEYRHEPERLRDLLEISWRILLIGTAVIIAGALFYGGAKFLSLTRLDEESGTLLPQGSVLLSGADLKATLDGFAKRAATYDSLKRNPPKITDPSK